VFVSLLCKVVNKSYVFSFAVINRGGEICLNSRFPCVIVMRKRSPMNHVKEGFPISILVFVSLSSTIFELMGKVFSAGCFLDKKFIRPNALLMKGV
jgi:hypothetical protein